TGANVFYDAFIVDVTTEDRMDRVSARGYGLGYIGSTIPFIISIAIILLAGKDIVPISGTVAAKIAFLITAVWWGLFTIPLFKNVQQRFFIEREPNPVRNSFKRLGNTFREIKEYRALVLFLL